LKKVRADKGQIEQVLMNLAVNARDAMPRGGKLVIETKDVEITERNPQHTFLKVGSYVLLQVADNGCGMSKEVQPTSSSLSLPPKNQKRAPGSVCAPCTQS
jgi:signal transduction histidine kinase